MGNRLFLWVCLGVFAFTGAVSAADLDSIQRDWAVANYQLTGAAQKKAFEALVSETEKSTADNPGDAALWIWDGIVKSSYAGIKGGLGALSLCKQSRKSLETAMSIDDTALQGSAYTSLGVLYAKVPGWPVGFGDDEKAQTLLKKALQINPLGIDPNYFYGEYLLQQGEYLEARQHLKAAASAAPRVNRELADAGRRAEIKALLGKVNSKLQ